MKIGKLSKERNLESLTTRQGLSLEEVLAKTIEANPELILNENSQIDPIRLEALVNSIREELLREAVYNQIADQRIYTNKGRLYDPEQVAALKQSNRQSLAELKKEITNLKPKLEKELEKIKYYVEYDQNSTSNVVVATYLFPEHTKGRLNYSEIRKLKELNTRFGSIQSDKQLNIANKKLDKKTIDLDEKYKKEIDMSVYYEVFVKGAEDPFDFSAAALRSTLMNPTSRLVWEAMPEKAVKLSQLGFSLLKDAASLKAEILENEKDINESNMDPNIAMIPLELEVKGVEASVDALQATLDAVDTQGSYIDSLLGGKEPVRTLKVRNKDKKYQVVELEGCFECFENAWKFLPDFKVSLDIEWDADKAIADLKASWEAIKAALDLPYLLQQNFCALVRFGNLCPIELAFIISSIVALIKSTWSQLFSLSWGFLAEVLFGGILKPLLDSLKIGLNFTYGPLENYKLCVINSLIEIQDIDRTGAWGFKSEDLYAWINGQSNDAIDAVSFDKKNRIFNGVIGSGGDAVGDTSGQDSIFGPIVSTNGEVIGTAKIVKSAVDYGVKKANDLKIENETGQAFKTGFMDILANPFLSSGQLDVLEAVKAIINEFADLATGDLAWINEAIDAVQRYFNSGATSRIELIQKISALGTVLTLAYGLFEAFSGNGLEPCIKMKMPDGTEVIGSPWSAKELAGMIDPDNIQFYDEVDSPPGLTPGAGFDAITNPTFVYNPLTDRRFNLTNCDKARSTIISKGESVEFWKRIALGANIDNV